MPSLVMMAMKMLRHVLVIHRALYNIQPGSLSSQSTNQRLLFCQSPIRLNLSADCRRVLCVLAKPPGPDADNLFLCVHFLRARDRPADCMA